MRTQQILIFLILTSVLLINCAKKKVDEPVPAVVIKPVEGTQLNLRGYVADAKFDLQSDMYKFSRLYGGSKVVDNKKIHHYLGNNKRVEFYNDLNGDLWEFQSEDISLRLFPYGLKANNPILIEFWKPILKISNGLNSKWTVHIDTTFNVFDSEKNKYKIQYYHHGEGQYDGWADILVFERKKEPYRCMMAYWPVLNTFILNQTTGDSIFVRKGNARQMFEPNMGAIKYITDFSVKSLGNDSTIVRKGTWELISKDIPKDEKK